MVSINAEKVLNKGVNESNNAASVLNPQTKHTQVNFNIMKYSL